MQHLVYSTVAEPRKQNPITIASCQDPDVFCWQTQGKLHNWGLFPKSFIAQRHNSPFLNSVHKHFSPYKIPLLSRKSTSLESSLQCYLSIHKFLSSFRYFLAWSNTIYMWSGRTGTSSKFPSVFLIPCWGKISGLLLLQAFFWSQTLAQGKRESVPAIYAR